MEEEIGEKTTVIATGGLAKKIVSHCKKDVILDEDLLLKGLRVIYEKNKAKRNPGKKSCPDLEDVFEETGYSCGLLSCLVKNFWIRQLFLCHNGLPWVTQTAFFSSGNECIQKSSAAGAKNA